LAEIYECFNYFSWLQTTEDHNPNNSIILPVPSLNGVARGGQVGARAQGRRSWGRISTLFAVI